MRRYLLVLDMDLLAVDEKLGQQPINYLLARHKQDQEPAEVVVLSLVGNRQGSYPRWSSCWARPPHTARVPRPSTPQGRRLATMSVRPPSTG